MNEAFPFFGQNDDTLKRLDAVGADLIRSKKHITQGGGRYPRNGYTYLAIPDDMLNEFMSHVREKYGVKFKAGTPEIMK